MKLSVKPLNKKYNLLIGMKTAESLKLELGSALNTVQSFKNVLDGI